MNSKIFSEECEVVSTSKTLLDAKQDISRADYIVLLKAYEKLLNQTMHITNISDMLSNSLNQYKHELINKVNMDDLTNIGNRRYLLELLERYCDECSIMDYWISAIMVDIDYFKNYNDLYGHISGDACLKKVAEAISRAAQHSSDFVARYGGEEFYVILPYTSMDGAQKVADRIMQNVAELKIPHGDNKTGEHLTISIGLTSIIPAMDTKIISLLKTCDVALYEAKAAGRNRIVIKGLTTAPCVNWSI